MQIGLRGRNEVPDQESVNLFYYEVMRYRQTKGAKHILVHCTHGHNRTGYMIASFLARTTALSVAEVRGLQRFVELLWIMCVCGDSKFPCTDGCAVGGGGA